MTLLISESWIDRTRNLRCGDSDPYEPFTQDLGKLFRSLMRENGRCVSAVYVDTKSRGTIRVGWVFEKRRHYEDAPRETYLCETWVTLYESCPVTDPLALRTERQDGTLIIHPFKHKESKQCKKQSHETSNSAPQRYSQSAPHNAA